MILVLAFGLLATCSFTYHEIPPVWLLTKGEIKDQEGIPRGPKSEHWLPLDKISRHTIHAFVAAEDARFFSHWGVDPLAVWKSLITNLKAGTYVRGASTISQQVVRMVFLSRDKNLQRKLKEALGAIVLEFFLSKEEILAWYLNLVPLGNGVIGIREASAYYFNEPPEYLTVQKSIQLAIILPSPATRSKALLAERLTEFGHLRFRLLIDQMKDYGYLSESLAENALATGDFGRPIQRE